MRIKLSVLLDRVVSECRKAEKIYEDAVSSAREIAASASLSPSQSGDRYHSQGSADLAKKKLESLSSLRYEIELAIDQEIPERASPPCYLNLDGKDAYLVGNPVFISGVKIISAQSDLGKKNIEQESWRKRYFGNRLKNMWEKAEEFLLSDKYIAPLVEKWGYCRIKPIRKALYFEDLVDAITSQQLSGKAAKTIFERVKKALKGKLTPIGILKTQDIDLRNCGLSWAKVKYVKDLAERVKDGSLKMDKLSDLSDEEAIKELTAVKGIGRWTAEMFLMFSLARPDVFPLDDLGIKKAFEKVTKRKWEREKAERFAKKNWAPFRTIASWYLWRSLEND